jgi:hypothetical protein
MRTFIIETTAIDEDGYTIATVIPGGGAITDHPYWAGDPESHYVANLSNLEVGDTIVMEE